MTKPNRSLTLNLQQKNGHHNAHSGTITIHAEEPVASRTAFEIIFRCSKLENKDVFSKSVHTWRLWTTLLIMLILILTFTNYSIFILQDPFLIISKFVESGISVPICKSEVINNNLNPVWKPVTLSMQQFVSKAYFQICFTKFKN